MLNLNSLNPQQREAVESIRGPLMILAGAGTGKTRVITYRIAHMISSGIQPENILGVTFTNKAAREMRDRVGSLVRALPAYSRITSSPDGKRPMPTLCTFHSLCARILRVHISKLGYKPNFTIYDGSDQIGVVKKILSHISAKGEKLDPNVILAAVSRCKNTSRLPAHHADSSETAVARHILPKYESALHAANAVDFDDLILLVLRLFATHPEALEACRDRYRFVMVDEYQDTNSAQFQLVRALTLNHRNLCVVGDDDQSIYGWRGAEIANLLDMEQHFPGLKVIKLEQNYRSTSTILNAANAIIKNNVRRRAKRLWSARAGGSPIILRVFNDDDAEARGIVEQIEFERLSRQSTWSDNAILFRTNAQSRPLETALRLASVRYHLVGGQSFFDRREVRDFLAYLRVFLNPDDEASLLRIANTPARGLSDATMERLLKASHDLKCPVFGAMKTPSAFADFPPKSRQAIEQFVQLVERYQKWLQQASGTPAGTNALPLSPGGVSVPNAPAGFLANWSNRFLDEIGYFEELRRSEKTPEAAEARIRNLRDLMAGMDARGSATPADGLRDFIEGITLDSEQEEEKETLGDTVTLITMHSCKGLEFPRVYIAGLEDGLLPHSRSKEEGTMDEERRLFYVALTRAMRSLSISHCAGRRKFGKIVPCQPSPFLAELPPELVEHESETAKKPVSADSAKNYFDAIREAIG
jgi:superfamily I DNA/RNA helicase